MNGILTDSELSVRWIFSIRMETLGEYKVSNYGEFFVPEDLIRGDAPIYKLDGREFIPMAHILHIYFKTSV